MFNAPAALARPSGSLHRCQNPERRHHHERLYSVSSQRGVDRPHVGSDPRREQRQCGSVRDVTNNVSSRAQTAASVVWTPAPWTTIGEAGLAERTPDITSIVQSIVNLGGWSALSTAWCSPSRAPERAPPCAYDLNPAAAPLLHIEYVPKRTPVVGNISIGDVSIIEGDTGTKTARRS